VVDAHGAPIILQNELKNRIRLSILGHHETTTGTAIHAGDFVDVENAQKGIPIISRLSLTASGDAEAERERSGRENDIKRRP
jgi:hypothetical protein